MRPTIIEAAEVPYTHERVVIAPPGNRLDSQIAPVEAMIGPSGFEGIRGISVKVILEPGDEERLARGEPVWLTFFEEIPPFAIKVGWE